MIASLFVLLLVGVGLWQRADQEGRYLFAGRSTSLFALTATLVMTEFNTATLLAFCSTGCLALPLVFLFGLLFYAVTVAKKWKEFDGTSVAEFFTKRYGRPVGLVASCSLLAAMAGFSAVYVKSLMELFPIPTWILLLAVLAMTLRGGLVSVIATDILSFFAVILFFSLAFFYRPEVISAEPLPGRFVVSLIVLTMFTYILAPWYGQKIFAARSPRVAFTSVLLASVIVFALYAAAIRMALPQILPGLPPLLRGLGYGVLFAASATTLTGVWSAMSAMLIGDFFGSRKSARRSKWLTIACAGVSYLLAVTFVDSIFDKMILANIPVAALSFALLAGFYWPRANAFGAYCSIVVGLGWGIGSYLFAGPFYTWPWAIYGVPLIFLSGIAGSLLRQSQSPVRSQPQL